MTTLYCMLAVIIRVTQFAFYNVLLSCLFHMKLKANYEKWCKWQAWLLTTGPFILLNFCCAATGSHRYQEIERIFWSLVAIKLLVCALVLKVLMMWSDIKAKPIYTPLKSPQALTPTKYITWAFILQTEFALVASAVACGFTILLKDTEPDFLRIFALNEVCMLCCGLMLFQWFGVRNPQIFRLPINTKFPPISSQ